MRRRRRNWTANLLSLLLGILIGSLAGLAHWHNVQEQTAVMATAVPSSSQEAPAVVLPAPEPEPYNDPLIPDDVENAARAAAEIYGLPVELLEAVAWHESRYLLDAVNGDCTGLMQVSLRWHADRMDRLSVTEADMWEAGPNMMVAADFLTELLRRYDGDLIAALMYYNGDGRLEEYLDGTGEPSGYAMSVIEMSNALQREHAEKEVGPMSAQK